MRGGGGGGGRSAGEGEGEGGRGKRNTRKKEEREEEDRGREAASGRASSSQTILTPLVGHKRTLLLSYPFPTPLWRKITSTALKRGGERENASIPDDTDDTGDETDTGGRANASIKKPLTLTLYCKSASVSLSSSKKVFSRTINLSIDSLYLTSPFV